jgi:hypothetical protein
MQNFAQMSRPEKINVVGQWCLDNADRLLSSTEITTEIAEEFGANYNSIRSIQRDAFKGYTAPWQDGYDPGNVPKFSAPVNFEVIEDEDAEQPQELGAELAEAQVELMNADYAGLEARIVSSMSQEDREKHGLVEGFNASVVAAEAAARQAKRKAEQLTVPGVEPKPRKPRGPNKNTSWLFEDGVFVQRFEDKPICSCPTCGVVASSHRDVVGGFGVRLVNGQPRPQSLCKACRNAHKVKMYKAKKVEA